MNSLKSDQERRVPKYYRLLAQRLEKTEEFRQYQEAFQLATGLPLVLVGPEDLSCHSGYQEGWQPLCCEPCNIASKGGACACFAEKRPMSVPVRLGGVEVGFLVTWRPGGVEITARDAEESGCQLTARASQEGDMNLTRTAALEKLKAASLLLRSFADQLGRRVEDFESMCARSEPIGILKARRFIHDHLDEPLPLGLVARQAALSESHFCRLFKEHVGMTLTDYVAHCRIAWAKKELLNTSTRVSEIAFRIGFQSLSQFNRSFARLVGCSPTSYRGEQREECGKLTA